MSSVIFGFITVFILFGIGIAVYMSVGNDRDRRVKEVAAKLIGAEDTFVSSWDGSFVALNYKTKRILIGHSEQGKQFNFKQILQVDLLRDNNVITSTNRGSQLAGAVIGGIALGPLGALAGALSSKTLSQNFIRKLVLRIIMDDGAHSLTFIDAGGSHQGVDPTQFQFAIDQADSVYGWILRAIRMTQQSATAQSQVPQISVSAPSANVDAIKKLWELKECGAISSVEYELEKSRLIGEPIFEQSTATREKSAVEALRPGEPPLGSLTPEEQNWLVDALAQLNRIYEMRIAGRSGESAFCIFEAGNVYLQFRASWDADQLECEAVSANFVPEIASILQAGGDNVLRKLGFNEPEISSNYSQMINIKGVDDLNYAARLGFRVLKEAYLVADFGAATFTFG
jgi:hypothetical protein